MLHPKQIRIIIKLKIMKQELCISIKNIKLSNLGCLVSGTVVSGSLSVGKEVYVYNYDEQIKADCRGLIKYQAETKNKLAVEEVNAGDEIIMVFSPVFYPKFRMAPLIFAKPTKLYSKFVLSTKLSKKELENLALRLQQIHLENIEIKALNQKLIGKAVVLNGEISVELIHPMYLLKGAEIVIWHDQTEIVRGNILKI